MNEQLQTALDTRILLEQSKGVLSHQGDLDMQDAYAALVRYARDHNLKLGHLARALVERTLSAATVLDHRRLRGLTRRMSWEGLSARMLSVRGLFVCLADRLTVTLK